MKKAISVVCMLLAFSAAVFAGGSGDSGSAKQGSGIVWCGWSGEEEASREIFTWMRTSWEEQNPGKTVTWIGWPWAETATQLVIRNQGNERIDIAQVDIGIFATIAATGSLADWNDLAGTGYLKDNFEEASLAVGQIGGKQLGLPWSIASIGMIYNPEILAKAGYSEPPKTVAEFEQCLEAIAKLPGDIIPYGVATKDATAANDFMPWLWTFGGRMYDANGNVTVNNTQGVQALTWYKNLMDKKLIRTNMSRFDARQLFAQGRIAFYDDAILAKGIAVGNGVPEDRLPQVARPMVRPVLNTGDKPRSMMWGHMLVVFNKSNDKDDAVSFAKHLVSKDVSMRYFSRNGMPPVLKPVIASPEVQNDYWVSNWSRITATGEIGEFDLNPQKNQLTTIIAEELQACLTGDKTPQKAADDAASRMKNVR
ncbi:ABC transporter substrate-binding protein [Breznakiella homolactica]|uniref:Sugar ABC transporter substrate-binding protein n=1 Tax=Breznakiella homolactica TaxID=2798577 RepID=A0A7T8BB33_9SPIR|nr:sugar ABC transporter substrate-binding protein [Breznakiella homolactica]QQO09620.1 sugar ABC transporter substrate-binding protein [Breznakiella homolactica]